MRRFILHRLLPLGPVVVVLALPATSTASEQQTATTGTQGETVAPAPAPETVTTTAPATPAGTTTTTEATTETTAPAASAPAQAPAAPVPQVQAQRPQGITPGVPARAKHEAGHGEAVTPSLPGGLGEVAGKLRAVSPSALTPSLPLAIQSSLSGLPGFFIENFAVPPFLLPIYQAAGTAYGIPWQVLAAINEVETDYGRDLSVSSAGAEGWMQFLPSEWAQYGVDANGDGYEDPYNPADAIFAAARYLRAAGGQTNIRAAILSYNHSQAYVESVLLRATLLGGTPSELLGAITGLTEARFPVHAAAHFSDGFPTVRATPGGAPRQIAGTTIYSSAGAPVIAVQDGKIAQIGTSPALGRFVVLRDAYGNTYTYAHLGEISAMYPVLAAHVDSTVSSRITGASESREPAPSGPATAGAQPRSPVSEGAVVSGLALGSAAPLEAQPTTQPPAPAKPAAPPILAAPPKAVVSVFRSGPDDVYLHPLRPGVQVIAGTVLGRVGAGADAEEGAPHIIFQIRPAGVGAPLIDPKPILDGWVALENSSIFRAKGENPFLATSPTIGQVLLESKQQLQPQVLRDAGIHLSSCGRQDVQAGRVEVRLLATLEYLSVSGLKPTVGGLRCTEASAGEANASAGQTAESLTITAVNGVPVAGHQGPGSVTDATVRRLLMLQGLARPRRITSLLSFPPSTVAQASPGARDAIEVGYAAAGGSARAASAGGGLTPSEWTKLIARLGEIPDPTVAQAPSAAAIPDTQALRGGQGGNH